MIVSQSLEMLPPHRLCLSFMSITSKQTVIREGRIYGGQKKVEGEDAIDIFLTCQHLISLFNWIPAAGLWFLCVLTHLYFKLLHHLANDIREFYVVSVLLSHGAQYAKTQTHTDRCEANSFPWWKLCRYLWDILGIWHVARGKKCVCVCGTAFSNPKLKS